MRVGRRDTLEYEGRVSVFKQFVAQSASIIEIHFLI